MGKWWCRRVSGQATPRAPHEIDRRTETRVGQDSGRRSACSWVQDRPLDLSAISRSDSQEVSRHVSSRSSFEDPARLGIQPAEASASGERAGCRRRGAMAEAALAANQKKARRRRAYIIFIDETGFRLQPVNRRTWAPTGQTPVQRAWDRYDRLSVIGAVALSPGRQSITTPFEIQEDNVRTNDVVEFIRQLRKSLRGPLIIVWDRWSVHRSAAKQISLSRLKNIDFEFLPAYAPELNPVEARWSNAKYAELANFVPDDVSQLKRTVRTTLNRQLKSHQLKESFFKTAKLKL